MKRVKIFGASYVGPQEALFHVERAVNAWFAANQGISKVTLHPTHAETGSASGEDSTTVYTVLVAYDSAE